MKQSVQQEATDIAIRESREFMDSVREAVDNKRWS